MSSSFTHDLLVIAYWLKKKKRKRACVSDALALS
jgi:hypothetical protein